MTACGEFDLVEFEESTPTPEVVDVTFRTGVLSALRVAPQECSNGGCHNLGDSNPASGLALGRGTDVILPPADVEAIYTLLTGSGGGLQQGSYGLDVNVADPDASLLLRFPRGQDPTKHSFKTPWEEADSAAFQSVRGWIEAGALPN